MLAHPDREIAIVDVHDPPAGNRDLGRHPAGDERGAVDDQDAVRRMRDLEVGEVAGADFVQIAPLVVVVALGMRVDQIIRTECVEDGRVAVDHGPVAPVLQGFDFVDRYVRVGHALVPRRGLQAGPFGCSAQASS